jgi:hypothetical protein
VKRYVLGAAAVGLLNAVLVLALLFLIREVEQAGVDDTYTYGFFSYSPLTDYQPPSRFPWEYVLAPLAVAVVNGAAGGLLLRRTRR